MSVKERWVKAMLFGDSIELIDSLFAIAMIGIICWLTFKILTNFIYLGVLVYWGIKLDEESFKVKEVELRSKWKSKKRFFRNKREGDA